MSAHTAHLQDLQHQVSVKTLALQSLQKEYDSLIQKLDRQRIKCATLERKFEVSDAELNALTEDRERLEDQVSSLQMQVDKLQQSRDETRRELASNNSQYLKIMEMDARLQTQAVADRTRWATEKAVLERRISELEGLISSGSNEPEPSNAHTDVASVFEEQRGISAAEAGSSSRPLTQTDSLAALQNEVMQLRVRNQALEATIRRMREENRSICSAARTIIEAESTTRRSANDILGDRTSP